ncbi:hypothetical protein MKZ38_005504 [Zalerion maritima]|uniref:Transmembrane protein 42 n=1 Tax=Zalerion maritima TaxID=339359 RepID=A0AAD5WW50_9PEZI|nr:hypothetical protein MKZ38_005504 [Zalerion maritima]
MTSASDNIIRQRKPQPKPGTATSLPADKATPTDSPADMRTWAQQNQWVILALASGACAAFNGVFAKLTTNDLTSHIADAVSEGMGIGDEKFRQAIEVITRGMFFALNLTFNGVMWTLFTMALSRGHSTTQVSIVNTSSNFMLTALMGFAIFSEKLPPLWWVGAAMLVAGNVVIGRKDEGGAVTQAAPGDGLEEERGLLEGEGQGEGVTDSVDLEEQRPLGGPGGEVHTGENGGEEELRRRASREGSGSCSDDER